jgi:hypothetical protein
MAIANLQDQAAPILPNGHWAMAGPPPPGGSWSIDVLADDVVISAPDGSQHRCAWSLITRDDQRCTIRLERPHPVLGELLLFNRLGGRPAVSLPDGSVLTEHVLPL